MGSVSGVFVVFHNVFVDSRAAAAGRTPVGMHGQVCIPLFKGACARKELPLGALGNITFGSFLESGNAIEFDSLRFGSILWDLCRGCLLYLITCGVFGNTAFGSFLGSVNVI